MLTIFLSSLSVRWPVRAYLVRRWVLATLATAIIIGIVKLSWWNLALSIICTICIFIGSGLAIGLTGVHLLLFSLRSTLTWWLFALAAINTLWYRSPSGLLSLHLLMFWLGAGIRWFEMLQVGILGGAARVVSSLVWIIMGVVQDDVWWKALDDPFMLQTFIWG